MKWKFYIFFYWLTLKSERIAPLEIQPNYDNFPV